MTCPASAHLTIGPVSGSVGPDVTALTDLIRAYVGTWYPDGAVFSDADQQMLHTLPHPHVGTGGAAWLARLSGDPVGCVLATWPQPETVSLSKLYVTPPARRTGVATELLRVALAFARDARADRAVLTVAQDRTGAQGLYRAHGFKVVTVDDAAMVHMAQRLR